MRWRVLARRAGVPGVVNIINDHPGEDRAMLADPRCSSPSPDRLASAEFFGRSCKDRRQLLMELGGNAPFLVSTMPISTLHWMARWSPDAQCREACRGKPLYVPAGIHDALSPALPPHGALKIGPHRSVDRVGPMITKKAVDKIDQLVMNALERGARLHAGGSPLPAPAITIRLRPDTFRSTHPSPMRKSFACRAGLGSKPR